MSDDLTHCQDLASSAVDRAVIESLRALYREPSVQRCMAAHARMQPTGKCYRAYRRKPWGAGEHWPVLLADQHLAPGGKVLVVGCGMGRMCWWFADSGYAVTGIDIVAELIEEARVAATTRPPENRPEFITVDGFDWPARDTEFDGVVMMATFLTHCPTPSIRSRLFSEAARVLRPGGCLLAEAADRTHPAAAGWRRRQTGDGQRPAALQALRSLPGVVVGPLHPFRAEMEASTSTAWYYADPRELWNEIEAAGLRVIRLQREQDAYDAHPCSTFVATV